MISRGLHTVTKDHLKTLTATEAVQFVEEMRDHGGRIGHTEAQRWLNWINKK